MVRRDQVNLVAGESRGPQCRARTFVIPQKPRVLHAKCRSDASQEEGHRNGFRICSVESLSGLPRRQRKPGNQPSQRLHTDEREQRRTITGPPASHIHDFEQARNEPPVFRSKHEVWTNYFTPVGEHHLLRYGAAGAGHGGRVIASFGFKEAAVGASPVNTASTDVDQPVNTGLPALLNDVACAKFVDLMGKTRVGAHI